MMWGNKKLVDIMLSGEEKGYRQKALEDTPSNNGWYTCPKCGRKFRQSQMDADHIEPKSKGGSNNRANMQLLCQHCNRSKGASTEDTAKDLIENQKRLAKVDKAKKQEANKFLKKMF
jgi:5-methylcytosine-specific restriction endonuclease McrA